MRSIAFRKLPADYRSENLEDCSALIRSGPDKADHVLPLVSDRAARRIQRILYVQYTNPAAYPPQLLRLAAEDFNHNLHTARVSIFLEFEHALHGTRGLRALVHFTERTFGDAAHSLALIEFVELRE